MKDTLDFQPVRFPCRAPEEAAAYQGYRIRVLREEFPANPWEEWEGEPPLLATGNAGIKSFTYRDPFGSLLASLTDGYLLRNQERILTAFDLSLIFWEKETHTKADYLRESIRDGYDHDPIPAIATLCELLKVEYHSWTSRGYAQGDALECILVATPEWIGETGIGKRLVAGALAGSAGLFDAYVWGDVYEFIIEDPAGVVIDAGGGYYGDYYASGLADDAIGAIAADRERREAEAQALADTPLQTA
jgi:hypothetical protein